MPKQTKTVESRKITTGNDHFKALVAKIKPYLPADWKERVLAKFPDLNNPAGFTSLQNIYYGRNACDVEVILYMADLAEGNKPKI